MKKKDKGFTLVEILAVILILGIISLVSVASIQGILKKTKSEYYETQKQNMENAAKDYISKNRKYLPKVNGKYYDVKLADLVNNKYISKVVDHQKEECNKQTSFVRVFKYSNEIYYTATLDCPNLKETLEQNKTEFILDVIYEGTITNSPKATISILNNQNNKDKLSGISSYQYKIYVADTLKYTSDRYDGDKLKSITKTIDLSNYVPGIIKIEINAVDIFGNDSTKAFKTNKFTDSEGPDCGVPIGSTKLWTRDSRTISIPCIDDPKGSGCAREIYTKEFRETTKEGIIEIQDKSGHQTECSVDAYVDKTPPICKKITRVVGTDDANTSRTSWTNEDVTITVECDDEDSGCEQQKYIKTYTTSTKEDIIVIKDKVGNTTECMVDVYVDKDDPTIPTTTWDLRNDRQMNETGGSKDITSKVEYYLYCMKTTSGTPDKWDECFTTNRNFERKCGRTTYGYAIAVDSAKNRSAVKNMGAYSDAAEGFYSWSKCSADCGGGTTTRYNKCSLIAAETKSCNTHTCEPTVTPYDCLIRGLNTKNTGIWGNGKQVTKKDQTCLNDHGAHDTALIHYCGDSNGKLVVGNTKSQNLSKYHPGISSLVEYPYICPTNPYTDGWTLIDD